MHECIILDAAEVVLFKCIEDKKDKEEVTAIEMNFEFLDDFEDPIKGGLYGLVHSCCQTPPTQDNSLELEEANTPQTKEFPASPVEFNNQNHVLQWMVIIIYVILCKSFFIKFTYIGQI